MNKLLSTAVLLSGMALATNASAATFTSDHCTGGCGGNGTAFATITGTQVNANTVDIVITPLNGNLIIGSGLASFTFNLTTNVDVTYSNLTLANLNPGFSVINGFSTNNLSQHAGVGATAIHNNGFGDFEYGVDFKPNGGGNGFAGPLSFRLTGTGLTLDDFAEKSINGDVAAFFALDIYSKATGNTGLVDCCLGQPTPFDVPIPAPLALFAAGLVGIGMLRRVTKKRTQADDLALS